MTIITEPADTPSVELKSHLHPEPSWQHADHVMPTGREETWRFTPLDRFAAVLDGRARNAAQLSLQLPDGATHSKIAAAQARELSFDAPVDLVAANAVLGEQADLIEIAAKAELSEPLVVDVQGAAAQASHLIIKAGQQSNSVVVLRHRGAGELASKIEIQVADGAELQLISLQDWSAGAVHAGQVSVQVGRDANVRTFQASIGGGDVRLVERAVYTGTGGELTQQGIYFVDAGQHVEHRMFVDHNHPHTVSLVDYRGALQGKGAHSVWIGDVVIRKVALDIETYETNKNLMLTEGCQADSVPNLEIETGEIRGAGHSSSTGRFDDEQLFYLRSRGIPEELARRLIVEGFFLDLIRKLGQPEIEGRLVEALTETLANIEGVQDEAALIDDEQLELNMGAAGQTPEAVEQDAK